MHDPGKPTAVVVLGSQGANAADVLAPYEVLAGTGAFNLYTIAARRQPVPLTGNLDLVPDLSFGQLDDRLPMAPDVIVVPQLRDPGQPGADSVVGWLKRQRAQGDPLVVSVCVGAEVLAEADLLDGRPATSHWLGLIGLRRNYPAVRWTGGVRYVDDGDVITTAGVLSGVDGACGSWSGWSGRRRRRGRRARWHGRTTRRARRLRSGGPRRDPPTWWGCSAPATGGTA